MWLSDIINYAKGSDNELLLWPGLGSILRRVDMKTLNPRVQRGMIFILMTMKFCVGLYGALRY